MFNILNSSKLLMFSLVAYVFFIPISTSLMNLFLYIALILIALNKDFIENIKNILEKLCLEIQYSIFPTCNPWILMVYREL